LMCLQVGLMKQKARMSSISLMVSIVAVLGETYI
jgi:hypothetical protein